MNPRISGRTAGWILAGLAGTALVATFAFVPPIPQDPAYHHFADRRAWLGIPNALDVLSNLPFLIVGLAGLLTVLRGSHPSTAFADRWERRAWTILFAGVALVAFGSGYYHLAPSTPRLFWDRL